MDDLVEKYNPTILNFKNGTNQDNILNNIPVYIINLENNITRRNYIIFIMNKMKINYTLVIVKYLSDIMYEQLKNISVISKKKLGCVISHLYCIKKGINSGSEKFLILEDDIIFHKQFNTIFTEQILDLNFDMLMLGAIDFNYNYNKKYFALLSNTIKIYTPFKKVLGSHANLYSTNFAKKLYNYKIANFINEFDTDFNIFYGRNANIYVCDPNLIVCELTTTDLNHNFSYKFNNFEKYIKTIFGESFTYIHYNYITIDFIKYVKNMNNNYTLSQLVDIYTQNINNNLKIMIHESLLCSGYTLEDITNI